MQTMPRSHPCRRLSMRCKVKMASKFCASSLELCKCFQHTPALYNLKEVHEGLRLSLLASTLDSARRLGVQALASLMSWLAQPREKKEHIQGVPGYAAGPPEPQLGTPPTHSTKSGPGDVGPRLQGCLFIDIDDLGQLVSVEISSLTLNSF